MSQHITADSSQNIAYEHGPFVKIGTLRIRRDFIGFYQYGMREGSDKKEHHYLYVSFVGGASSFFTEFDSKEDAEKEVERLDWLFSGLYKKEKE